MASTETFVVVKRRNKKKNFKHVIYPESKAKDGDDEISNFDINNFVKRLSTCIAEVELSDFFSQSFDLINRALDDVKEKPISSHSRKQDEGELENSPRDLSSNRVADVDLPDLTNRLEVVQLAEETEDQHCVQVLSYGIGNFTSSLIARYQLAFLLSLQKKLACKKCSIYDPAFTVNEKLLLEKYNCEVISQNEEGCRECFGLTVAFLPHCGRPLYNNLLWKNLSTPEGRGLKNLVLIGNSFSQIVERTPTSILKETGTYILKLQPHITEVSLPENFSLKDVFNDLSVHTFPPAAVEDILKQLKDAQLEKPIYEAVDVEFIRK